jgi:hypothetical protein
MSTRIRLALLCAAVVAVFLSSFLLVQALGLTLLDDPRSVLHGDGIWPGVIGARCWWRTRCCPCPRRW